MNIKNTLLFLALISAVFVLRQTDFKVTPDNLIQSFKNRMLAQRQLAMVSVRGTYCSSDLVTEITQAQIDEKNKIFESLNKQRGGDAQENQLSKALIDQKYQDYGMKLVPFIAPWIVLAIISLIGWGCYCLCCVCDCCCPPSKCCRRDLEKKPFTRTELSWPNYCQMLFGVLIIAFGIVSFVYDTNLKNGLNNVRCNTISFVDDLIFGKTSQNTTWIGIQPVQSRLQNISIQVVNSTNEFTNSFKNTDWLDTASASLNSQVTGLYNNNKAQKVNSPNPASSSAQIDSLFITEKLGPQTTKDTMTYVLDQEFTLKTNAFIEIVKALKSASKDLTDQTSTITSALNSGVTQVQSYTSTIATFYNQIVDFLKSSDVIFLSIVNFFYGFWGAAMFAAVLSVLGSLFVQLLKFEKCRFLLHVSWCIACILMIIGFLLSAVVFPTTIVLFDFCNVYEAMLSLQSQFQSYDSIMSKDITNNLNICLFGNGNIAAQFGMDNALSTVNKVDAKFKNFTNFINNPQYSLSSSQTTVTIWIDLIEGYRVGNYTDSSATNDDNAWNVLTKLNQNTDSTASSTQQSGCSSKTSDLWLFYKNSTNCGSRTSVSASSVSGNLGSASCLDVGSFQTTDVTQRYSTQPSGCPTVTANINKIYSSLKSYDDSRRSLFSKIKNELTNLKTDNDALVTKLLAFQQTLLTLKNNVQLLLDNIGHPQTGIANSFNCQFLRQDLVDLQNGLCVAFLVPMYYMLVFIIVGSILMLFNSCFAYTAAMRHSKRPASKAIKQTFNAGSEAEMQKFNSNV